MNTWTSEQAWAAAVAADRLNGGYFKVGSETQRANKDVVFGWISENQLPVTDSDRDAAQDLKRQLQSHLTFLALKNSLQEFHLAIQKCLRAESFTVRDRYLLSILACLPDVNRRNAKRAEVDNKLSATKSLEVAVDSKVNTTVTLVKQNWSQNWNTYYLTGVTDNNEQVFFAYREPLALNASYAISGRVKRHANNSTQLSRVRVIKEQS